MARKSEKTEKFNDYIGIPCHRELKDRVKRISRRLDRKTVPTARILLERAVQSEEQAAAAGK